MSLPTTALSLRQPWASLVVDGHKLLENRVWNTHFRGPFLVHAAKGMTDHEYAWAVDFVRRVDPSIVVPKPDALLRGGLVGRATLVDVIPPCQYEHAHESVPCACGRKFHMGKQYGFVLEDVAPLPFRPVRGLQRWFRVPEPGR